MSNETMTDARALGEGQAVAWYVFAGTEHWVTLDRREADDNRADGYEVRPLVYGDIPKAALSAAPAALNEPFGNSEQLASPAAPVAMPEAGQCDQIVAGDWTGPRNCAFKAAPGDTLCKRHRASAELTGYAAARNTGVERGSC